MKKQLIFFLSVFIGVFVVLSILNYSNFQESWMQNLRYALFYSVVYMFFRWLISLLFKKRK